MALTMHSASVPVLATMLRNMLRWLDKAQDHAQARRFDTAKYLDLKLAPDMLPLLNQVQIATDTAKGCAARLAGVEVPKYDDKERSFDELRARLQRTVEFVESISPQQFDGSETREVVLPLRNRDPLTFDGESYLRSFALPNFFFHATMTYALLRAAGVELGKLDYLGAR